MERIQASPELRRLGQYVRFSEDDEGLRIDLMDEADFTMFRVGTDELLEIGSWVKARELGKLRIEGKDYEV